MILCVRSMSYHGQSDPPLIARGALSSVTKPWYLVLLACYLIKTNLQVFYFNWFCLRWKYFLLSVCVTKAQPVELDFELSELKGAAPKVK